MMNHPANELDRTAIVTRRFDVAGVVVDVFEDGGDPRVLTSWPDGLELLARPNPDDGQVLKLAVRLGYGADLELGLSSPALPALVTPRALLEGPAGVRLELAWRLTRDHELAHTWRAACEGGTPPPWGRWSASLRCAAGAVVEERPKGQRCPHDDGHALEEAIVLDLQAHLVGVWGPAGPRPWDRSEVEAPTGP